jgi:RNA polymerase sigma-70 factor (ECF subfamily)
MVRRIAEPSTDEAVMERVRGGDTEAFLLLCDRLTPTALAIARGLCADERHAERVVGDTFALLWRSRAEYEPQRGRVRPWVLGILRLRAIVSRPARPEPHGAAEPTDDGGGRRLRELLEVLPSNRREIVVLAFYGELTVEEIADQLDLSPRCVNDHMRLAVDALAARSDPPDLRVCR